VGGARYFLPVEVAGGEVGGPLGEPAAAAVSGVMAGVGAHLVLPGLLAVGKPQSSERGA
jgi:hypothetical protein